MGNVNCLRCRFRHEDNGTCVAVNRFCTAVPAAHCPLLREYLDTELTPQEVLSMKFEWCAMMDALNSIGGGYTRLRELAEADRDGRLVMPPCKPGDTVYEVTSRKTISEYRVKAIRVELFCTFIEWDIVAGFVDKSIFGVPVNEIGKTVFLTREEAEKALEAMKDGNG